MIIYYKNHNNDLLKEFENVEFMLNNGKNIILNDTCAGVSTINLIDDMYNIQFKDKETGKINTYILFKKDITYIRFDDMITWDIPIVE